MTTQQTASNSLPALPMSRRNLLLQAAAAGLTATALAAFAPRGTRAADSASAGLDEVLAAAVAGGVPGVAVRVERGGELVYSGVAGLASIEQETPLTTEHRFRLGSIAKAFTSTVVLQLVDEGVLNLDDTVAQWLDDPAVGRIPNVDQITLRQLMNHSSGIFDYLDDGGPFEQDAYLGPDADWAKVWTLPELLAYADGAAQAPYFEPGQGFHYSNTGYILLGLIVERATGRRLVDEMQDRIMAPLALKDTFLAEGAVIPEGTVDCYHLLGGELVNVTVINLSAAWAAGAIVSTTTDLARFGRAVFAGELVSPASFTEMFTYVYDPDPRFAGFGWGMGVRGEESPQGDLLVVGGDGPGYAATMIRQTAEDISVVVLINTAGGEIGTGDIRQNALKAVLGPA